MKNENENYFDPEMKDDFKGMEGKILEEYDVKIIHNLTIGVGYKFQKSIKTKREN